MESFDVLFQVEEFELFHIDDIEDPMSPGGSPVIDWKQHVLFVSDNLTEGGAIEAKIALLSGCIGLGEER